MQDVTLTIIQPNLFWKDKTRNLEQFSEYFERIGTSDIIVLPEMFSTGFIVHPEEVAEGPEGPTLEWMQYNASSMDSIITGSIIVKDREKFYNRLYWVQPDGDYRFYDKRHLFHMAGEHERFDQGKEKLIVNYKGWKFCPLICYDLRFPVWIKNNYLHNEYDYDVLIFVANWPKVRSLAWKSLLLARAIENQAYVVGVNRVGKDGNGIEHSGDSAVISPHGRYLVSLKPGKQDFETIELSMEELTGFRNEFQVGRDWDKFQILD